MSIPTLFLLALLPLSFAQKARAAYVRALHPQEKLISIVIEPTDRVFVGNTLCIVRMGEEIACGELLTIEQNRGLIEVYHLSKAPLLGENLDIAKIHFPKRFWQPQNDMNSLDELKETSDNRTGHFSQALWDYGKYNVSVGGIMINPYISFEWGFSTSSTVGLMGLGTNLKSHSVYPEFLGTGNMYGALLSYSRYSGGTFNRWWLQFAGGMVTGDLSYKNFSGNSMAFVLLGTVGWRSRLVESVNWGIGIGAQFVYSNASRTFPYDYRHLSPVARLDIGYSF